MKSPDNQTGYTLTEILIVVTIIAILAAVAIPGYQQWSRESKRADAHTALLSMANAQEKQFPNDNTYVAIDKLGRKQTGAKYMTDAGLYTLTVAADASTFTITATAEASSPQFGDKDCREIQINQANQRLPAECW